MLFWIATFIDFVLFLICLYETFAVSSNSSLAKPALLLLILMVAGFWYRSSRPGLALALVGIPAAAALLFGLVFLLMFAMSDGRWQ